MHPECFRIGAFPIHWYGVMMATGFMAGLASWVWLGRRTGRSANACSDLLFWIMVSGILGARLAYVISDLEYFLRYPMMIIRVDRGGLIYYGGFVGATLATLLFARSRKENPWALCDFAATSLPLAHAFGRVGCFLNSCCFGAVTDGPAGVRFPLISDVGRAQHAAGLIANERVARLLEWFEAQRLTAGEFVVRMQRMLAAGEVNEGEMRALPVHPVQLYEAGANLVIYVFLIRLYLRRRAKGAVVAAYFICYSVVRFLLEYLRGDRFKRLSLAGLSSAQWFSIVLFLVGVGIWAWVHRRGRPAGETVSCSS